MHYQTYEPHPDLAPLVKCHWTLEVPAAADAERQRIVPDGCLELAFILGDDIKRYVNETEFILQPRAMVLGQTTAPFYIEPQGYVNTFAVRFYPYGFANFVTVPIKGLANTETPLTALFEPVAAKGLEQSIVEATDTMQRIEVVERFLLDRLHNKATIDRVVKATVDALLASNGSRSINAILAADPSKRRQLERKFMKQIGMSPKQLGKVIRLQTALCLLLGEKASSLTEIAYESEYYDQSHFIKDFREFTGTHPGEFLGNGNTRLSSIFYKEG